MALFTSGSPVVRVQHRIGGGVDARQAATRAMRRVRLDGAAPKVLRRLVLEQKGVQSGSALDQELEARHRALFPAQAVLDGLGTCLLTYAFLWEEETLANGKEGRTRVQMLAAPLAALFSLA
jgi:hypothetical protein